MTVHVFGLLMLLVEVASVTDLILLTYSTLHALHATLQSLKYTNQPQKCSNG